ncbi:MAG: fibrobacter succinogenes major paralogous domain-containing protein [Saprospiraceae bacterium]
MKLFSRNARSLFFFTLLLSFAFACKKEHVHIFTDPIISWENPAAITFGTLLSKTQLNASANVAGTFIYTPALDTKLFEGSEQELKVEFTPDNTADYNKVSKSVKISVLPDGTSNAVFNTALVYGTVRDNDGNNVKTITIGTQTWTAENLRSTRFRNGDPIPQISGNTEWKQMSSAACCTYDNTTDKNKIATNGRLYNWFAVSDVRNMAPPGWHVATDAEYALLSTVLAGDKKSGGALKETGPTHWTNPNTGATNSSGFTALPGGRREFGDGTFINNGYNGFYWTSSAYNPDYSWYRFFNYNDTEMVRANFHKQYGFAVRCVKD